MVDPISRIYIMNVDGSNPQRLVNSEARWPAWSPDGKKIAFISYQNGMGELHIYDLVLQAEKALVTTISLDGKVAWSPDGQEILINSYLDNAHGELYRVDIAFTEIVQITSGESYNGNADWKGEVLGSPVLTPKTENTSTIETAWTPTIISTDTPAASIDVTPTETSLHPTTIPTISSELIVESMKIIDANVQQVEGLLGNPIETFALGVDDVEEVPDGGEARTYQVGKYTIRVNYDQNSIAKGLQVIDGLFEDAYSLDQSGVILTRFEIDLVGQPDIEAPLERQWTNINGYTIVIAVDTIDGHVWTVRIYKLP